MIPKDKFTSANWFRYYEYRMTVDHIADNLRFNFVDEKHVVNHNGVETKVRANPFTGAVDAIMVGGNFRDTRSLVATISVNPKKKLLLLRINKRHHQCRIFYGLYQADGL